MAPVFPADFSLPFLGLELARALLPAWVGIEIPVCPSNGLTEKRSSRAQRDSNAR